MNSISAVKELGALVTTESKNRYVRKDKEGNYSFVSKNNATIADLKALVLDAANAAQSPEEKKEIRQACINIHNRLQHPGLFKRIFSFVFKNENTAGLQAILETQINSVQDDHVSSLEEAELKFFGEFSKIFGKTPKAMSDNEKELIKKTSKLIWESKEVNKNYEKYKENMIEFYSGSHMLFVLPEGVSILETLKSKALERVSSHYVEKVGDEMHHHIMGSQLPETLFHEGVFAEKEGAILPGKYYEAPQNGKAKVLSDQEKTGAKKVKAFWIQTERTPDGPSWKDLLYHRTVDFVQYFLLKNVFHSPRPQIANYVGPKGRGVPDSRPIVLHTSIELS